ncbi:phasin family protein [Methylobacterium sp. ID0610]|uniref:phasin family protein n=1 Tax=Methylobacterium carpenticola TaxID=3344827 RepID=UPI0036896818
MNQQFDTAQKFGKESMDTVLRSFGTLSKGGQAIAVEAADFAKQSFEQTASTMEKLAGVRSLDKAIEIQTEYLKTSYERFLAQSTKMAELYGNLAKEMVKPLEAFQAKVPTAA